MNEYLLKEASRSLIHNYFNEAAARLVSEEQWLGV